LLDTDVLATSAAKVPPAAATSAGLPALKAVLAIHGTVASRLEWNRGLLAASGTDHAGSTRFTALVPAASAPALLFVLLSLAACLAALRRRIPAITEEFLILCSKCEGLPAIAAHQLLIFSHKSLSNCIKCVLHSKPIELSRFILSISSADERSAVSIR
jgi:hypothetical protein